MYDKILLMFSFWEILRGGRKNYDMATIRPVFDRKNKSKDSGKGSIDIYFYEKSIKRYFSTGIVVSKEEWSTKNWVVKNRNALKLNSIILDKIRELEDYHVNIISVRGLFDEKDLKNFAFGGSRDSFLDFLKEEIKTDNTVVYSTKKYREMMLQKLTDAVGDITFARANYEMVDAFHKALTDQGLKPATIRKYHNQLKKFCGIAFRKGFIKESPYSTYKVKRPVQGMRNSLWYDDLNRIWGLDYNKESTIELVRLKFLFSCYTGLRISDNTALTWGHIRNGKIMLQMKKTSRPVIIPLDVLGDRAGLILNLLGKDSSEDNLEKKIFRQISGQEVNRYLKLIAIDAKISIPTNFHLSRHTFSTLVADKTGSVFEVMRYAGIYRVDTAMIYINLAKLYK